MEFINLNQGTMSVNEYSIKLNPLARYESFIVANSMACMRKFVSSVSKDMVKEYRTNIMVKKMDISLLMVPAHR